MSCTLLHRACTFTSGSRRNIGQAGARLFNACELRSAARLLLKLATHLDWTQEQAAHEQALAGTNSQERTCSKPLSCAAPPSCRMLRSTAAATAAS